MYHLKFDNLILQSDTGCVKETKTESKSVWQPTPVPNLVRYIPSGILFARVRVKGKLIRNSAVKYPPLGTPGDELTVRQSQIRGKWGTAGASRSGRDRAGAVSGLNLGTPAAGASGSIEADVATPGGLGVEVGLWQQVIAQPLQWALGDFFECPPQGKDGFTAVMFGQG